jgi:hypothetical protein
MPGNRAFVTEFKYEKYKEGEERKVYMEALKTVADEVKNLLTKGLEPGQKADGRYELRREIY